MPPVPERSNDAAGTVVVHTQHTCNNGMSLVVATRNGRHVVFGTAFHTAFHTASNTSARTGTVLTTNSAAIALRDCVPGHIIADHRLPRCHGSDLGSAVPRFVVE